MQVCKLSGLFIKDIQNVKVHSIGEKNKKAETCETDPWSKQKGKHNLENQKTQWLEIRIRNAH